MSTSSLFGRPTSPHRVSPVGFGSWPTPCIPTTFVPSLLLSSNLPFTTSTTLSLLSLCWGISSFFHYSTPHSIFFRTARRLHRCTLHAAYIGPGCHPIHLLAPFLQHCKPAAAHIAPQQTRLAYISQDCMARATRRCRTFPYLARPQPTSRLPCPPGAIPLRPTSPPAGTLGAPDPCKPVNWGLHTPTANPS